jgi:hypothetical protein
MCTSLYCGSNMKYQHQKSYVLNNWAKAGGNIEW